MLKQCNRKILLKTKHQPPLTPNRAKIKQSNRGAEQDWLSARPHKRNSYPAQNFVRAESPNYSDAHALLPQRLATLSNVR